MNKQEFRRYSLLVNHGNHSVHRSQIMGTQQIRKLFQIVLPY
ncbi:hypothetical protein NUZ5A_51074 [Candidatus Nitrosotenuis uzonensis]|uniref:Uncharacterized protein n=1 Tax=Candidatus Nitrosotenuis uzonensis TaxID=1407055 RepID=A0A812F2F2_9ARCH|nr:hypothetical protein NUZ5A_51074 [Candidatus Nitrosotenuis uzonensis]